MIPILDQTLDDLRSWLTARGLPAYRAGQIRHWVFQRRAGSFEEMTELPKSLRTSLAAEFTLWTTKIAAHKQAADGTEKLLLELHDGQRIECVLLRDRDYRTICISTQVGCAMGCVFCASGIDGVVRNLSRGEIIEQMLLLNRLLPPDERLRHIVVMGMGEPLANINNLLPALADATSESGLGIGARKVTISTVGLPDAIRRLAAEDMQYRLAVSLHAPNDALRTQLVPVNKAIGIEAILSASDEYYAATGRRLTFEYVLLKDLNDQPEHAQELVARLRGRNALVNVIPFNPVSGLAYQTPSDASLAKFTTILVEGGVQIKVRRRRGDKIDAACGQLRRNEPVTLGG